MNEIMELYEKLSPEGKAEAIRYVAQLVAQQASKANKTSDTCINDRDKDIIIKVLSNWITKLGDEVKSPMN